LRGTAARGIIACNHPAFKASRHRPEVAAIFPGV
jgi:hypothetical protein